MTRKHFSFSAIVLMTVLAVLTGCAGKKFIDANSILQPPKDGDLYTNYNIWFEDPKKISSRNYHQGNILPFGTVVKDIHVVDDTITFTTAAGDEYAIDFEKNYEMIPIEDFLKRVFTTESAADVRMSVPLETYEKIRKGQVATGMTKKDVIKSWGYPSAHRTPTLHAGTWIFWDAPVETVRVVFNGDNVSTVIRF